MMSLSAAILVATCTADVRLALVVEHNQFVFVFRLRVGIAQPHGEIGRIAAAEPVDGNAAGQRTDEADLDLVLGVGGRCGDGKNECRNPGCCKLAQSLLIRPPSIKVVVLAANFSQLGA